MEDYVFNERRKNKNDERAKRRARLYKQGGFFRGTGVREGDNKKQD